MSKKEQLPANAVQSEAYVKDFFDALGNAADAALAIIDHGVPEAAM